MLSFKTATLGQLALISLFPAWNPSMAFAQRPAQTTTPRPADDPVATLVKQLDLEKYKATIKGLTLFGDRRQGTERNRKAVDWIEAQFKSYGCANVERIRYDFTPPAPRPSPSPGAPRPATPRGRAGQGGSTLFGNRARTGVNNDPMLQPDEKLRALNAEQTPPGTTPREEVYCTKIGTTHPEEMYIVGGHMDGIGWGEAANDDGSGTAISRATCTRPMRTRTSGWVSMPRRPLLREWRNSRAQR